ncbi:hypothetical protein HDU89_004152 [Geranomyces variabilis]|nr:hypothetical protein HDU89_004152 [Geranomyces variabilis]
MAAFNRRSKEGEARLGQSARLQYQEASQPRREASGGRLARRDAPPLHAPTRRELPDPDGAASKGEPITGAFIEKVLQELRNDNVEEGLLLLALDPRRKWYMELAKIPPPPITTARGPPPRAVAIAARLAPTGEGLAPLDAAQGLPPASDRVRHVGVTEGNLCQYSQ